MAHLIGNCMGCTFLFPIHNSAIISSAINFNVGSCWKSGITHTQLRHQRYMWLGPNADSNEENTISLCTSEIAELHTENSRLTYTYTAIQRELRGENIQGEFKFQQWVGAPNGAWDYSSWQLLVGYVPHFSSLSLRWGPVNKVSSRKMVSVQRG